MTKMMRGRQKLKNRIKELKAEMREGGRVGKRGYIWQKKIEIRAVNRKGTQG